MDANGTSNSQRRVLDTFTWFESEVDDEDNKVQALVESINKDWLAVLHSCGRPKEELVDIILQTKTRPQAVFDNGTKRETVFLSEDFCEIGHVQKMLHVIEATSFDWKRRLGARSSKSFCIPSTLHRVTILTKGAGSSLAVIGFAVRAGRALPGLLAPMCPWLVNSMGLSFVNGQPFTFARKSVLLIGQPGVGKTTLLRELAYGLSCGGRKTAAERSVVVVDKINEIAGESDAPNPCIGEARWMPCNDPDLQAKIMREAVENATPDVVLVDDISNAEEVEAARSIMVRGVSLVATVHGKTLVNILQCAVRHMLVGGVQRVTREVKQRKVTVGERIDVPVFDVAIELLQRDRWIVHPNVKESVDRFLKGQRIEAIELRPGMACAVVGIPEADGFQYCTACAAGSCSVHRSDRSSSPGGKNGINKTPFARSASPARRSPVSAPGQSPSPKLQLNVTPPRERTPGKTNSNSKSPATTPAAASPSNLATSPSSHCLDSEIPFQKGDKSPYDGCNLSDPRLLSVADRMGSCLVSFYKSRGIHHGMDGNWQKFFQDVDEDGSGRLSFDELDSAVRDKLRARLTRYELRVFWRFVDADGSGEVTLKEFVDLMYRLKMASWPDLDDTALARVVSVINTAAEKWHRCGGNWFKIFKCMNPELLGMAGSLPFDEFSRCLRGQFPGLDLRDDKLPEADLKGLWKLMDDDFSREVTAKEFMKFMKREGGAFNMHKLTSYSKKHKGIEDDVRDIPGELSAAPQLENADLAKITGILASALQTFLAGRGIGSGVARSDSPGLILWTRLFAFLDADGSGRLGFVEFETALKKDLNCEDLISHDELCALWSKIDADGSLEISEAEFVVGIYQLQLEHCPVLDSKTIERHVEVLNRAAEKWHRASGNWYKLFNACDWNGSGDMDFEEFLGVVRKSFPCLAIPAKELPYNELRGLWRAIDEDKSGKVDFKEFMYFMRTHAPHNSFTKMTDYTKKKRGLCTEKKEKEAKQLPVIERSRERMQDVANALDEALTAFWSRRGVHVNIAGNWPRFFEEADEDGSGRLGFEELEEFISKKLRVRGCPPGDIIDGVTREDLIALWRAVDEDGSGEVTAKEWENCLYKLEVETWDDGDDSVMKKCVDIINSTSAKWHKGSHGNWFRIFRLIDKKDSGEIGFDELKAFCYRSFPDLQISEKILPEAKLKSMWKKLDEDHSGMTDKTEFMVFMRKYGSYQFVRSPMQSRAKDGNNKVPEGLSEDQIERVRKSLCRQTSDSIRAAFSKFGIPWTGLITEWDMLYVMRDLLQITEDEVSDDGIHLIWGLLEKTSASEIIVDELLRFGNGQKPLDTQVDRFGAWPSGKGGR